MANRTNWVKDSKEREMRPGVISMAVVNGEHMTIGVTRLEPGNQPMPHSHESEQIACILSGTLDMHVGDRVERLGPGDILQIPPNVIHYGVVVGDQPVMNLDAWYPHRVPGT